MNQPDILLSTKQEKYFFETFPLIQQITERKLTLREFIDGEDISQEVKLSLLIWQENHRDKFLTQEEWLKFVNRVTHNRIKARYRTANLNTISLSEADQNQICLLAKEKSQIPQQKGNTTMELNLLVTRMWEIILTQSFFENCSLLLKNDELTVSLIYYRGCRIKELAERLHLTQPELEAIIEQLPLSDKEIAELLSDRFALKATPAAIRKARQRATDQLQTAIYGKSKKQNHQYGKASGTGKT